MLTQGDCLEVLKTLPDSSIDSIVTDPPYEIGFMNRQWDKTGIAYDSSFWKECLRVLKPGGHLLAFSGTRTYHRMACAIEDAGFEIRDMIEWLYLSGFPKGQDVGKMFDKMAGAEREVVGFKRHARDGDVGHQAWTVNDTNKNKVTYGEYGHEKKMIETAPATDLAKQWDGWGTALKPAHEPIVMARKPIEKTVAYNVEKYGTGAVNVDGCRIATEEDLKRTINGNVGNLENWRTGKQACITGSDSGRFPANCITLDADEWYSKYFNVSPQEVSKKASKRDRNSDWQGNEIDGEDQEVKKFSGGKFERNGDGTPRATNGGMMKNTHPTVKPVDLMRWLIRLVTPPNGVVLDPFSGSGSTLIAAKREGFQYIGVELDERYIEIAQKRLKGEAEPL